MYHRFDYYRLRDLRLFILLIIYKRLRNSLPEYNYISYGKIAFVIIIEWCITIVCNVVFPNFFAPIIVLPIIASTVFDDSLEYIFSLYLVIVSSLCWDFSTNIVLCYVTMILFGGMLAHFVKESEYLNKLYTFVILLSVTTLISIVFYYFNYLELTLIIFIYALGSGVVACIITAIIFPLLNRFVVDAQETVYEAFLDPDFSLFNEVRKFSYIEFKHATRISNLSKKCAKAINANYRLAECAAFYYRLGKIEGEPMIDNAIKLANNYCFPNDVIQILSEYGGIVSLPSTKESAIVHMVDSVVTKVELFDSDSMSSSAFAAPHTSCSGFHLTSARRISHFPFFFFSPLKNTLARPSSSLYSSRTVLPGALAESIFRKSFKIPGTTVPAIRIPSSIP